MFKATMTVQTTWAIIKMRPKVDVRVNAGSFTEILSSSTRPSNSQNIAIKALVCLKCKTQPICKMKGFETSVVLIMDCPA